MKPLTPPEGRVGTSIGPLFSASFGIAGCEVGYCLVEMLFEDEDGEFAIKRAVPKGC